MEALLELARTSQMSFSSKVGEQRKVLMEVRCQRWYSGSPFAGYSAQQDIKPFLEVLERVSITEHALAFPPHREGAFRQNLAVYGVARCDTLEKHNIIHHFNYHSPYHHPFFSPSLSVCSFSPFFLAWIPFF